MLSAMSWCVLNTDAPYVMKVDDDTYVNIQYLVRQLRLGNQPVVSQILESQGDARNYIMGAVVLDSAVVRDEEDKWFLSQLEYPSDYFPTYTSGNGYVMTRSAMKKILAASFKTDMINLEDVFITGILAREAQVTLVSHPGFSYWTSTSSTACDMITGKRITSANLTIKQFNSLYANINSILRTGNMTECVK